MMTKVECLKIGLCIGGDLEMGFRSILSGFFEVKNFEICKFWVKSNQKITTSTKNLYINITHLFRQKQRVIKSYVSPVQQHHRCLLYNSARKIG